MEMYSVLKLSRLKRYPGPLRYPQAVRVSCCLCHLRITGKWFPGTDATHAEHIETIKARMYVGLTSDKRFLPGHLGMGLVEGKGNRSLQGTTERLHCPSA
jgi:hypothetical protein